MNSDSKIEDSNGKAIVKKDSIKYLGALLHRNGRIDAELNCKIGIGKGGFQKSDVNMESHGHYLQKK